MFGKEDKSVEHTASNSDNILRRKRVAIEDLTCAKRIAPLSESTAQVTLLEDCRESSPIVVADWLQTFKSMPKQVQSEALSDLVGMCSKSHVKHLQNIIAPHFQKDFVLLLPKEISLRIISYLAPADLVRIAQLSSYWRRLAEDHLTWARKCVERRIVELPPPNNGRYVNWQAIAEQRHKEQLDSAIDLIAPPFALLELPSVDEEAENPFFSQPHFWRPIGTRAKVLSLLSAATDSSSALANANSVGSWMSASFSLSLHRLRSSRDSYSNDDDADTSASGLDGCLTRCRWKAVYLRDRRVRNNWRRRRVSAACELRGHDEHVITCMQTIVDASGAHRIVTGSDDYMLRVWSVANIECERVLIGHTGGVWTLQVSKDGQLVVSGSTDRSVRVWRIEDGVCLHTLNGHTSTVRCMALKDDILVSGSRDCTVRVWNIREGCPIRTLFGHLAAVRCVQFNGRRIISGGYDHNLIVWDAASGEQLHVLTGHSNRVYSLLYDSERGLAVSGSLDTTIRVWRVETGDCLQTLVGHQSLTSGIELFGDYIVSANADSTIKIWSLIDGQCVHTLAGPNRHSSAVTSLQVLASGLIVSSGDDGKVKLWDLRQGSFLCDLVKLETGGQGGCVWRVKTTPTMLICAVGSRNSTEDTKLIILDFDAPYP